jgi:hypothetical protein
MHDEDTGEAIQCPYCESEDHCEHLLAVLDHSFLQCSGGYAYERFDEFDECLRKAFGPKLRDSTAASHDWKNSMITELWAWAKENAGEDGDSVIIDGDVLLRLVVELLEDAGGDEYPGLIDTGGGASYSSVITLFHASSPKAVFNDAVKKLRELLEPGGPST